mmetsp:Transcript_3983/g.5254  ORF Transcript_3983/g.5254 Transcript_3983/m.5254 type:complete len:105 (-) Transcript_3983:230-544(-)
MLDMSEDKHADDVEEITKAVTEILAIQKQSQGMDYQRVNVTEDVGEPKNILQKAPRGRAEVDAPRRRASSPSMQMMLDMADSDGDGKDMSGPLLLCGSFDIFEA